MEVEDPYCKNYKALIKETEDDSKLILLDCNNNVKRDILPKKIYRFNAIHTKTGHNFYRTRIILPFIWNHRIPRLTKANLRKNNKRRHKPSRL